MNRETSVWYGKNTSLSNYKCWLDLFYKNVELTPDKIAVIFENRYISYRELDLLSNWFCNQILKNSNNDNDFIGIHLKRSHIMLAAMIGVAKAGKAYLPLDPSFPKARLLYMLEDSGTKLIIADENTGLEDVIGNKEIQLVDSGNCVQEEQIDFIEYNLEKQPAYILYTSGSTGKPKGVVVGHKAFLNFLLSMKEEPGCNSSDVLLALTTISFDISGLELFLPLICGGTIYVVSREVVLNPKKMLNIIETNEISIIQGTPALWKLLIDYGFKGKDGLKILCGGDIFPLDLAINLYNTGCPIWNMYGPTETTIWSSVYKLEKEPDVAPYIGFPIANTGFHILDEDLDPVEKGEAGLLWISGDGLSDGYWKKQAQTNEVFKKINNNSGQFFYNTGDWVYETIDGNIAFSGRKDNQVKIRGYRIEISEIEKSLINIPAIKDAVVLSRKDSKENTILVAFYILDQIDEEISSSFIRNELANTLPEYMIPAYYFKLDKFPMTLNNKIDRTAFPDIGTIEKQSESKVQKTLTLLEYIQKCWNESLGHKNFSEHDNFFDVGGYSVLIVDILHKIGTFLNKDIDPLIFFENPTIYSLNKALTTNKEDIIIDSASMDKDTLLEDSDDLTLAIIGMSCAVPGAENVEEFWELLSQGKSGILEHSVDDLINAGMPLEVIEQPNYIRKSGILPSTEYFDHEFFGYSPKEAKFMDPQHRLFMQHCYKALESAGIKSTDDNKTAVFAGSGQNKYLLKNIIFSSEKEEFSDFQIMVGNENDFLASRVSYKLNLRGPAVTVQSGCSTSLVAVQLGYQSLLNYQCDMALCGGVSLNVPVTEGYLYEEGSILSPTGECRAFDVDADGTVFGSGVGVILLKRLSDAVRDNDPIIALLRSVAINNDGADKIGYTAPSIRGQAEVISEALALADVSPELISYVETHGTGTILGDPIEISGLKKALNAQSSDNHKCYIGSVKTNIGHLDTAAGIVSLIKTALSIKNKKIPASLNYLAPNPVMKLEETNLIVNSKLRDWEPVKDRIIAGVSSFGIGGTNAHAVLEKYNYDDIYASSSSSERLIFPVSAKNEDVLKEYLNLLYSSINEFKKEDMINAAFTLNNYRNNYIYRGYFILSLKNLNSPDDLSENIYYSVKKAYSSPKVVMLFSGQGTQYTGMISELYNENHDFRKNLQFCSDIIKNNTGWNVTELLFDERSEIYQTEYTQPLLFAVEWSIAKTLIDYGLDIDYLIGHSLGEYTAACIAGAFSIEEGLQLVIDRGRIMASAGEGHMLAVFCSFDSIESILEDYKVSVAGKNSPKQVVLSGSKSSISEIQKIFDDKGIISKQLGINSAFHSELMEPILDEFRIAAARISYKPLNKIVVSNCTGNKLEKGFIYNADYWVKHLRGTILFEDGIKNLADIEEAVYIEAGPGAVLINFIRVTLKDNIKTTIQTIPVSGNNTNGALFFTKAIGDIWKAGCNINLDYVNSIESSKRINLPTYPFLKKKLWISPDRSFSGSTNNKKLQKVIANEMKTEDVSVKNKLKRIWSIVLGYEDVSIDENFFDLGGDSLLSAKLIKEINEQFLTKITLKEVMTNPTISGMESIINKKNISRNTFTESSNMNYVIKLNDSDSDELFYCVVGVQIYKELAENLSDIGRCYGTYLPEEEELMKGNLKEDQWDVKDLARSYKKIIIEHSKGVSVNLIGISFGGLVAYEIAKQLKENGIDVKLLVMLDSLLPFGIKRIPYKWVKSHIIDILKNGFQKENKKKIKNLINKKRDLENDLIINKRQDIYKAALELFVNQPQTIYYGESLLVKAQDENNYPGYKVDPVYGWEKYINKDKIHTSISPGGHLDILKSPNVRITAKSIRDNYLRILNDKIK